MVYNCINYIQSLLFPPTCLLCGGAGEDGMDLCKACREELPCNHSRCYSCALPLPPGQPSSVVCGNCLKHPPPIDHSIIPFIYDDPVNTLVSSFKFSGKLQHGRVLSELFMHHLQDVDTGHPDLIIPVPLHSSRLKERGFNQALELARPIARQLQIPISINACKRERATDTQSSLKKKMRRKNVRGAFSVSKRLEDAHLVLVDDVVTTGSTVMELARMLKKSGAIRVDVWAMARTL